MKYRPHPLAACLLAAGLGLPAMGQPSAPVDPMLEGVSFEQRLNSRVPGELTFRDSEGKTVTLDDYLGDKPILLSLVYYECPMLCTLSLNGMVMAMRDIPYIAGTDYTVLTISFDHEETHVMAAQKKEAYLETYARPGSESGWHFLVGEKEPITTLCRTVGFGFHYDPASDEYAHRAGLVILTPEGVVSRYLPGIEYDPRDLRLSLVEASQNRIGTIADKIALLCYHYDPSAGVYSFFIMNIVRIGCLVTVVVLAVLMVSLFRTDKKGGALAQS